MAKPTFSDDTKLAIKAAIKAGHKTYEIFNRDFKTHIGGYTPLTEADLASNEIILNVLASSNYPILSEESKDTSERLSQKRVWIVDPLDGTSDFVEKSDEFSVMIGLVKDHIPIMGVVYQPVTNILYVAEKGLGAYARVKNKWQKLVVSEQNNLPKTKAVVSRHHLTDKERNILSNLGITKYEQHGSAGLKIAIIAIGAAELYFTTTNKIKHWDSCAAFCLISEAGGKITDMLGNELIYNTEDVTHKHGLLISNGLIHDQVVRAYKEFIK